MAPFWADADTGNGNSQRGTIRYGLNRNEAVLMRARDEVRSVFSNASSFTPSYLFVTTWERVGYYAIRQSTRRDLVRGVQLIFSFESQIYGLCLQSVSMYTNHKFLWGCAINIRMERKSSVASWLQRSLHVSHRFSSAWSWFFCINHVTFLAQHISVCATDRWKHYIYHLPVPREWFELDSWRLAWSKWLVDSYTYTQTKYLDMLDANIASRKCSAVWY